MNLQKHALDDVPDVLLFKRGMDTMKFEAFTKKKQETKVAEKIKKAKIAKSFFVL